MIHNPIYLPYCRLFDSTFFEFCSRNKWFFIPCIWIPVLTYISITATFSVPENPTSMEKYFYYESPDYLGLPSFIACFLSGLFFWTFGEYMLHRYLFHFEHILPDYKIAFFLHFIIHGIHHMIPMDPDRLVFPPALGIIMYFVLSTLFKALFGTVMGPLLFAGFGAGYICYDVFHYYVHHGKPALGHFKEMKSYHTKHHYVDGDKGYGITSKIWDKVFKTELK